MDEPAETLPSEPIPAPTARKKRWPLMIGVLVAAVLLLSVGFVAGSRALYARTFDSLVAGTRVAEGAQVWKDFFIAQDCFIDAVVEAGDAELAFSEGLALLEESDLLARHVTSSLSSFSEISVLPVHTALAAARDAIISHYQVWEAHLGRSTTILSGLEADPAELAVRFQTWIDVVVADLEPIESTFTDSESAFQSAAIDDPSRLEVDTLFTPSETECSRGAV